MRVRHRDGVSEVRGFVTRNLLKQTASVLEINDFIAMMMMFVTGLSAYAT
jgi:hypothetical protein